MSLLIVHVDGAEADLASDWLWMLGAIAIEERHDGETGKDQLVAGFADADQALAVRSVIGERWPVRFEVPPDESTWRDVWLRHLQPVRVGHLVVHPPWVLPKDELASVDLTPLSIDPGRAFGSGHHESTQLALLALQAMGSEIESASVLDVGSGTGVLSVAAAALGARRVVGIDVDLDITELARTNAQANGQEPPLVEFTTQDIAHLEQRFDVVVANMTIGTVSPLLPDIAAATANTLVLSGLLHEHLPRVNEQLEANPTETWANGPWVAARWTL